MMKFLGKYKRLSRVALAIVLVGAMAASLLFVTPSPVKALNIAITNPQGQPLISGTLGQTYNFQVKVSIENYELLPIQSVDLSIVNSVNATYKVNATGLPLVDGGSVNYTNAQTGGGTVNVTAVATTVWLQQTGYGFVVWQGDNYTFGQVVGYTGNITYNVAWTPPAGWPQGSYNIGTKITAADGRTFTQLSSGFTLLVGLVAETSIAQALALDGSGVVVVKVNINRIKDPTTGNTAAIPGGIGSYTAKASSVPSSGIQLLAVKGVPPFPIPTFDNVTGVFSVATVSSPPQASNTTVAAVVPILTGNTTASYGFIVAFQAIGAAAEPGLYVSEEQPNSITLLRGDADKSGAISITDSLALKQYLVGQLLLSQINPLNAATPNHDGASGDKITITDALAIEQSLVGQLNAYYQ